MGSVDFSWLIGGPQGSGVESGANVFSKVCAELGYQIFGKREFHSPSPLLLRAVRVQRYSLVIWSTTSTDLSSSGNTSQV